MIDFEKKIINSDKFRSSVVLVNSCTTLPFLLSDAINSNCNFSGIYKITCIKTNKSYIGQAINIRKRIMRHRSISLSKEKLDLKFYKAIRKYGLDNFIVEILIKLNIKSKLKLKEKLNELEIFFINKYNSYNHGYNSTPGGDSGRLGYKHNKNTIDKMRKSAKNRIPKIAKDNMKIVYGFDIQTKTYYKSNSITEMGKLLDIHMRQVSNLANGIGKLAKKRFLFSFNQSELKNKIKNI